MPDEPKKDEFVDTLILSLDRRTMTLGFNGDVWERIKAKDPRAWDVMLNILGQASRQADVQYRIICAMEAQQQIKAQQAEETLRQSLMGRGQN